MGIYNQALMAYVAPTWNSPESFQLDPHLALEQSGSIYQISILRHEIVSVVSRAASGSHLPALWLDGVSEEQLPWGESPQNRSDSGCTGARTRTDRM